jgi:hypothetical protein
LPQAPVVWPSVSALPDSGTFVALMASVPPCEGPDPGLQLIRRLIRPAGSVLMFCRKSPEFSFSVAWQLVTSRAKPT